MTYLYAVSFKLKFYCVWTSSTVCQKIVLSLSSCLFTFDKIAVSPFLCLLQLFFLFWPIWPHVASAVPCCGQLCLTLCDPMDWSPQTPLPMEFSRQEYWSGLSFLLQGILPTQESNPGLLHLLHWEVSSLPLQHLGRPCYATVF